MSCRGSAWTWGSLVSEHALPVVVCYRETVQMRFSRNLSLMMQRLVTQCTCTKWVHDVLPCLVADMHGLEGLPADHTLSIVVKENRSDLLLSWSFFDDTEISGTMHMNWVHDIYTCLAVGVHGLEGLAGLAGLAAGPPTFYFYRNRSDTPPSRSFFDNAEISGTMHMY